MKSHPRRLLSSAIALPILLAGCAVVFNDLDSNIQVCRTLDGKYWLDVSSIQTVRGSFHTPFSYGNESVNAQPFAVVIPSEIGSWSAEEVQVWGYGVALPIRRGTVSVSKNRISMDMDVAAGEGPRFSVATIKGAIDSYRPTLFKAAPTCPIRK